jgi:hypothetical protein
MQGQYKKEEENKMIFRHFADPDNKNHSYLIASAADRIAAIVNPISSEIAAYRSALDALGLRLVYTLETDAAARNGSAAHALREEFGSARVAHVSDQELRSMTGGAVDLNATVAGSLQLGPMTLEFVAPPIDDDSLIAYRICCYEFRSDGVLTGNNEAAAAHAGAQSEIARLPAASAHRPSPLRKVCASRDGLSVERQILEDLHSSLIENRFTPKESRVTLAYIRYLEQHGFQAPTAETLSQVLGDVDRTAVHVLVHNIRWRQIRLGRLPLLLEGQTSKWLKGLQTEPSFTDHEKEFLQTYLELVAENRQPPSGPEIAQALSENRSVQWVRKRAHTIRRKQKEFSLPTLILTRKNASDEADSESIEILPKVQSGA